MTLPTASVPRPLRVPYAPTLASCTSGEDIESALRIYGAEACIDHANWPADFPYAPEANVLIAHTGCDIYLLFTCHPRLMLALHTADQSPVSQDSCVEFFVQPCPGGEYWNFEFNCIGAINASHRMERPAPTRLSAYELAQVRRYSSLGTEPFAERPSQGPWSLAVVIPLQLIGLVYEGQPIEIKGNFYACASASSQPFYLSWNPISAPRPNFHLPESFGSIILV